MLILILANSKMLIIALIIILFAKNGINGPHPLNKLKGKQRDANISTQLR
jgi:hypothetical protein